MVWNERLPGLSSEKTSNLTWLHISDLHWRESEAYDANKVANALLRDLAERTKSIAPELDRIDLVFVTGDIAFEGKPGEYALAKQFFDELQGVTGVSKDHLFIVPGNHDADKKRMSYSAYTTISLGDHGAITDLLGDDAKRTAEHAFTINRFSEYERFVNEYMEKSLVSDAEHLRWQTSQILEELFESLLLATGLRQRQKSQLLESLRSKGKSLPLDIESPFYVVKRRLADRQIAILGFNSAWISDDDQRRLSLEERLVREALSQAEQADIRIALMHHPLERLRDSNHDAYELLLRYCDFVLHGHLHQTDLIHPVSPGSRAMVIGAGACYETREHPNAYNLVNLGLDSGEGTVYLRMYSDRQGGFWTKDTLSYQDAPGEYAFSRSLYPASLPSNISQVSAPALDEMHIQKLGLRNFKCFEEETLSFPEKFTVLIGDNASGKTAFLEALVVGIGTFFLGIDGLNAPPIQPDQVRLVHYKHGETTTYESQYPVQVSCEGVWGNQELKWMRIHKGEKESFKEQGIRDIVGLAKHLQEQVRSGEEITLPLIAYYSTGRLWRMPNRKSHTVDEPGSRLRGYKDCLDPASHVDGLMQWMKAQELIALQENKPNSVYEVVKEAIKSCVGAVRRIYYNVREDDMFVCFSEDELPFRMLSEGVRNMLAMVADIAYRAAILNPQFAREAARMTPGVVLIDEIDLHLHPKWQRRVVEDLRHTFPRMQFITTTHSPFIIQSLRPGELVDLQEEEEPKEYANRSIEDIAEEIMGIELPQRSQRYQRMYETAKEYYALLQEAKNADPEKKRTIKQSLDELAAPFSDNVAYHAFLEMKRTAAGLGEDDDEAH